MFLLFLQIKTAMGKINTTYKQLADYIFNFFKFSTTPGTGLFLFRVLNATVRNQKLTQSDINLYNIVIFNLLENGYLEATNEALPFVKITEKGYNYLHGDNLIKNKIDLINYIDLSKDDDMDRIFNDLWTIIGKKDVAPFYVDGTTFFNTINPFVNVSTSYSIYTKTLLENKESTSRISWFRVLFKKLKKADIPSFLKDLSLNISTYYDETESVNYINDSDIDIVMDSEIAIKDKKQISKKVFITYCWENNKHNEWVHKLASDLEKAGFNVIIDIKQPLGTELNRFMEQTIANVDKVLIIATPEYKRRADNRERGVGYETSLITDDLIKDQNRIKFIPIIRSGGKEDSYPIYLGNRKGLSMKEEDDYNQALEELINNIRNY